MENINFLDDKIKRIHIKIGTQGILPGGYIDQKKLCKYCDDIVYLKGLGKTAYFTSSGAIATGRNILERRKGLHKELDISETEIEKQRLSAIGQPDLLHSWGNELYMHKLFAAQILVDYDDLKNEKTIGHTKKMIEYCLENSTIPVINYNDSRDSDEIQLDNDTLASEIACMMKDDLLIILTSTNGIYGKGKNIVPYATSFDVNDYEPRENSDCGRGGLETKLAAAKRCNNAGIPCIISNYDSRIYEILRGDCERTVFMNYPKTLFSEEK